MATNLTRTLVESAQARVAEQKALLAQQEAGVAEQKAGLALQEAGLALLSGSLPDEPVIDLPVDEPVDPTLPPPDPTVPPPVPAPPAPKPYDPISGLPWKSGFGQCAEQLADLIKMRGRPVGAYSGWSNFQADPENKVGWNFLRGGASDDPEKLGGVFAPSGAFHFHRVAQDLKLLSPSASLIWMFPMSPLAPAWKNDRRSGSWSNPQVWRRCGPNGESAREWRDNYQLIGRRLGVMLQRYKRPPENFTLTLGWEGTGSWYPWSVGPDAPAYVVAWRLAIDAMRAGLRVTYPKAEHAVTFEFRYAGNQTLTVPWTELFPGRDHAGVLGASLHADVKSWSNDANWQIEMRGDPRDKSKLGLLNALEFAKLNRVPLGVDEWGIQLGGDDPKHPADADPVPGFRKVAKLMRENAAHIAHECFLWSGKANLLGTAAKEVAGRKAYLEGFGKVAAG